MQMKRSGSAKNQRECLTRMGGGYGYGCRGLGMGWLEKRSVMTKGRDIVDVTKERRERIVKLV